MKKAIALLLVTELPIAIFVLSPTCVRRRGQLHAFAEWHQNPNPMTRAELDRQSRITELYRLGFSAVAFGVMAAATLCAARIGSRRQIRIPSET